MTENITQEELDERVAVLKKFRELLEKQRAKFQEYLFLLEKQEGSISSEDADALITHSNLQNQIVDSISSLQKVIDPMQKLYEKASSSSPADAASIEKIKQNLDSLQTKVLEQNKKNQEMLKTHMNGVRTQILNLNNPYKGRKSIYAEKQQSGSLVQIDA